MVRVKGKPDWFFLIYNIFCGINMWESCTSNHWQQPPESNLARCTSIYLLAKKNDVDYKDFGTFVLQAEGHEDFIFSRSRVHFQWLSMST